MSKKKIKITKQEAWSLGCFFEREISVDAVIYDRKELFLEIKKKYER